MLTKSMETFVSATTVLVWYAFTNRISNLFSVAHPRRRGCSGGTCSRRRSAGDAVEEKDDRCPGHGWCLHTDCVRSAQNCKLCFSTAGYYPQPILFSCCLWFLPLTLCFSPPPPLLPFFHPLSFPGKTCMHHFCPVEMICSPFITIDSTVSQLQAQHICHWLTAASLDS